MLVLALEFSRASPARLGAAHRQAQPGTHGAVGSPVVRRAPRGTTVAVPSKRKSEVRPSPEGPDPAPGGCPVSGAAAPMSAGIERRPISQCSTSELADRTIGNDSLERR